MRRLLTTSLAMLVGIALSLASVLALLEAALRIELIDSLLLRTLAILATLVAGVALLVLSVFLYVRLAVLLFAGKPQPPPTFPPS